MIFMTQEEKQIPKLILDAEYLSKIFEQRIRDIDRQGEKLLQIRSYRIKSHFDDKFFHYVIQNNLTIGIRGGLRRRYKVFCVAFSGHGRRQMFQVIELVHKNGFDRGGVAVPRPLWYIEELMSFFYVGVPGQNLLEHIKNGDVNYNLFSKIGAGLFNLHNIKVKNRVFGLKWHDFSMNYLDPTGILERGYNQDKVLARRVKEQLKELKSIYKKIIDDKYVLSHGDFHPENVIVHEFKHNKAIMIDFSESCFAPAYYDMASFLQQLEFMSRSYITREQYQKLEGIFLRGYWGEAPINAKMMAKINLYKSWTTLKSVVYFMIFEDEVNMGSAEYLLRKSREYIEGR